MTTIENKNPSSLFKFFNVSTKKYFSRYVEKHILQNRFGLKTSDTFNDPYDRPTVFINGHEKVKLEDLYERLKNFDPYEHRKYTKRNEGEKSPKLQVLVGDLASGIFTKNFKIGCLTNLGDSASASSTDKVPGGSSATVMFAHYAYQHRGLMVEYDYDALNTACSANNCDLIQVNYLSPDDGKFQLHNIYISTEEIEKLIRCLKEKDAISTHKNIVKKLFQYKAAAWQYEKEWRIIGLRNHLPLECGTIKRIYLGLGIKQAYKDKILKEMEQKFPETQIEIYCCDLHYNTAKSHHDLRTHQCSTRKRCNKCNYEKVNGKRQFNYVLKNLFQILTLWTKAIVKEAMKWKRNCVYR